MSILKEEPKTARLDVFDVIGGDFWEKGTTAKGVSEFLQTVDEAIDTVEVHINSNGGDAFEGIAIHNLLKQSGKDVHVYVDGIAASAASVIAMAGTVHMPVSAQLMIHNPWTVCAGNAKELRKVADDLDKVAESSVVLYLEKAGDKLDRETLIDLLDAESYLCAEECLEYGLCDEIIGMAKPAEPEEKEEAKAKEEPETKQKADTWFGF